MPIPNLEKEEILDKIEELFIMGIRRPSQVLKISEMQTKVKTFDTANQYIEIVKRRIRNKYKKFNREEIIKKELRDLDFMEKKQWINYSKADNSNERTGIINSFLKIKERRAKILGLDTNNINLSGRVESLTPLGVLKILNQETARHP